jgi:hypothetical protein
VTITGKDEVASLLHTLVAMRDSLTRVVSSVRQGAEGVATASSEIAQGNKISLPVPKARPVRWRKLRRPWELDSTVKQNAESASQANQLSLSASKVAVQGGEVVGQVVETMKGINESSRKIADIISIIDSIAFQTNILASMRPWKPHVLASRGEDLQWWPAKCVLWLGDRPKRPKRSRH